MTLFKDYKKFFEQEFELEYHDIYVIREQVNALIAALEAAQAEATGLDIALDESMRSHDVQKRRTNRKEKRITKLNKQLAEAQDLAVETEHQHQSETSNSQAEVERLQADNKLYAKHIDILTIS